jgi:hypothetical protein
MKIIFFDDLKNNVTELIADICQWLEIDPSSSFSFGVKNRTIDYRNRTIHKYIRPVHKKYRAFWRKHPRLTAAIRSAYYRLNAAEVSQPDPRVIERLTRLYGPYNNELRLLLLETDYRSLPDWLSG